MFYPAFPAVVVGQPVPFIGEGVAAPVGGCGNGRASAVPAYDFDGKLPWLASTPLWFVWLLVLGLWACVFLLWLVRFRAFGLWFCPYGFRPLQEPSENAHLARRVRYKCALLSKMEKGFTVPTPI